VSGAIANASAGNFTASDRCPIACTLHTTPVHGGARHRYGSR